MSHSIRLRGPWEFSIAGTQFAGRVDFPCDWSALQSAASAVSISSEYFSELAPITVRRRFHLPTGLQPGDRIVLVLRYQSSSIAAQLNGNSLRFAAQTNGSIAADVTGLLAAHNELTVALPPPCPAPLETRKPVLEAALEIHAPD